MILIAALSATFIFGALFGFSTLYMRIAFKAKRIRKSLDRNPVPNPILVHTVNPILVPSPN